MLSLSIFMPVAPSWCIAGRHDAKRSWPCDSCAYPKPYSCLARECPAWPPPSRLGSIPTYLACQTSLSSTYSSKHCPSQGSARRYYIPPSLPHRTVALSHSNQALLPIRLFPSRRIEALFRLSNGCRFKNRMNLLHTNVLGREVALKALEPCLTVERAEQEDMCRMRHMISSLHVHHNTFTSPVKPLSSQSPLFILSSADIMDELRCMKRQPSDGTSSTYVRTLLDDLAFGTSATLCKYISPRARSSYSASPLKSSVEQSFNRPQPQRQETPSAANAPCNESRTPT